MKLKNKLFFCVILVSLLLSMQLIEASTLEAHGVTLSNFDSGNLVPGGMRITMKADKIIYSACVPGDTNPNTMYIRNSSGTILKNVSIINNCGILNYVASNGEILRIEANSSSTTHTRRYSNIGAMPVSGTYLDWNAFSSNGADDSGSPTRAYLIVNITLNNITTPTITFQGQTPTNQTTYFYTSPNFSINTTTTYFGGTTTTSHYIFNSSGSLLFQENNTVANFTSNYTGLDVGTYYFNATVSNTTLTNLTETRIIYIYNITVGGITSPINNTNVSSRYMNITWSNGSITPSGIANISYHELFLYNSTLGYIKKLTNTTNLNFTNWDIYSENLTIGIYYLLLNQTSILANTATSNYVQINLTTNALLNITAKKIITNDTLSNFTITLQDSNYINRTLNTTTGLVQADIKTEEMYNLIISGNQIVSNSTTYNTSIVFSNYNFSVAALNSLYIYFYNENNLLLLNTTTTYLDLIGNTFTDNYSTSNGTLLIDLLVPETYLSRYYATNYTERFYYFTVSNDSYQVLNLYLNNDTDAVLVQVKDRSLNVVEGAVVKAQKFVPSTGQFITVEIGVTDFNGEVLMSLTLNDEFYRFIVSVDGETRLTTEKAYLISDTIELVLPGTGTDATEIFNYLDITNSLTFNEANQYFLFTYNDPNNLQNTYCLKIRINNASYYNTSCITESDADSIILYVTNVTGRTYTAMSSVFRSGTEIPFKTLSYTYKEYPPSMGTIGFLIQFIITMIMIALVYQAPEWIPLMFGLSLLFGGAMGLLPFSQYVLNGLAFAGAVLSIWLGKKKNT